MKNIKLLAFTLILASGLFFADEITGRAFAQDLPTEKELIDQSAASRKAYAEKMLKQAKELRELETSARTYAEQAKDIKDKESWLKDAEMRAAQAKKLEDDAAKEQGLAGEEEQKAESLAAPTLPVPEENKPLIETPSETAAGETSAAEDEETDYCVIQSPQWTTGLWKYEDEAGGESIAIVQVQPDSDSPALELHSRGRVWKGTFTEGSADEPRVKFTYKPKVEEINPEIPEVARRKIAGALEWTLELHDECIEEALTPHLLFYPGEVAWDGDGENARIKGKGEARRKNIMADLHIMAEEEAESFIGISLGAGHDYITSPVESLTKNQRFFIAVRLPYDLAKETGRTLKVTLKGLTGEESDEIELEAGAMQEGKAVAYMSRDPATLADSNDATEVDRKPQFMSLNWIFGNSGDRLDLDAENGEIIRVSYQDLSYEVPLYNSWVQSGLARFKVGEERMRTVFQAVIDGPYDPAQKGAASKRITMLDNYNALIASDKLNDVHRYNLGELYLGDDQHRLGLVQYTDAELAEAYQDPRTRSFERRDDPEFFSPMVQAYLEGLSGKDLTSQSGKATGSITWVSPTEQQQVEEAIRSTTRRLQNDLLKETYKNLSFGMYQGFVAATQTEDFYLVATGRDAFDKPVPGWMRATMAVGMVSGAVLKVGGMSAPKFSGPSQARSFGLRKATQATLSKTGKGRVTTAVRLRPPPMPKTVSAAQAGQLHTPMKVATTPGATTGGPDFTTVPQKPKGAKTGAARPTQRPLTPKEALRRLEKIMKEDEERAARAAQMKGKTPVDARQAKKLLDEILEEDMPEPLDPDRFKGHPRERYIKSHYPDMVQISEDYRAGYMLQQESSCQAKALEWIIRKRTGFEIGEVEMDKLVKQVIAEASPAERAGLAKNFSGITQGYPNWMINRLATWFNMKVSELPSAKNAFFKIENFKPMLDAKYSIKAVLKLKPPPGSQHALHAVSIEDVVLNRFGMVSKVRFFDSNVGAVMELPGPVFQKMLLSEDYGYGAVTAFK